MHPFYLRLFQMNLTNANKARHTEYMKLLLKVINLNYNVKTRLGTRRSLDGAVFDIGNNKVLKFILTGRGHATNMDTIVDEFLIGKKMGEAGLGPKVYEMHQIVVPNLLSLKNAIANWPTLNNVRKIFKAQNLQGNINNMYTRHPGSITFNIFQNWYYERNSHYNKMKEGAVIIMENISSAVTLGEYVKKHPFPLKEYMELVDKMHAIGIAHGDMHPGNIMVKKEINKIKLYAIDFGRSSNKNRNSIYTFVNKLQNNHERAKAAGYNYPKPESPPPRKIVPRSRLG